MNAVKLILFTKLNSEIKDLKLSDKQSYSMPWEMHRNTLYLIHNIFY